MNKIKLILTFVVIIGVMVFGLYWIATNAARTKADRIKRVNKEYGYGKGIILDLKSYKGHSIEIKYKVAGRDYTYSGGWDNNSRNLGEGDSIAIRYALDAPEFIITELDNEY